MRVSIVTISYDQSEYLARTVESVLTQDHADIDYIVVDAGSTDGSREYLEGVGDPRIRTIFESDQGPADGLNKGFRAASGEIVGAVNSDDYLLPGSVSRIVRCFERSHADVVYGNGIVVDREGDDLYRYISAPFDLRSLVYGAVPVMQPGSFVRRRWVDRVSFNEGNRTCWDAEYLVDLALAGARIIHAEEDFSAFRLHDASITGSSQQSDEYHRDMAALFERVMGRPRRGRDALAGNLRRMQRLATSPSATLAAVRRRSRGA